LGAYSVPGTGVGDCKLRSLNGRASKATE